VLRFLTAGESHGPGLLVIVDGVPAGMKLLAEDIDRDLRRRQQGYGSGGRMSIEHDHAQIISGVRHGHTLGSPVGLYIENRDWVNWQERMAAGPVGDAGEPVTRPRPGHADLAGGMKYHHDDFRNVLERASARETAARVGAGAVARVLLGYLGIRVAGFVLSLGDVEAGEEWWQAGLDGLPVDLDAVVAAAEDSPVRCPDPAAQAAMAEAIRRAQVAGDTLGGVIAVLATGVPPGLGSYSQWDRRLDARLGAALMSINAVKGVEVGAGFTGARRRGSQVNDPILPLGSSGTGASVSEVAGSNVAAGGTETGPVGRSWPFARASNWAGGLEGGVTDGEPLVVHAAVKPLATLAHPLPSVDIRTGEPVAAHYERSDVTAVPRAVVVAEAAVAWELAVACMEKFGGDHIDEIAGAYARYLAYLKGYPATVRGHRQAAGSGPEDGPGAAGKRG